MSQSGAKREIWSVKSEIAYPLPAAFAHSLAMRDHKTIIAWQEARAASLGVFELARTCWKPWCAALFSQIQRSALSVQLNIAEGYAYGPGRRQAHHFEIAYGSAIETGELLELAGDSKAVPMTMIDPLLSRNRRSQRLLLGLVKRCRTV